MQVRRGGPTSHVHNRSGIAPPVDPGWFGWQASVERTANRQIGQSSIRFPVLGKLSPQAMEPPETRHAQTADGVQIAHQEWGEVRSIWSLAGTKPCPWT